MNIYVSGISGTGMGPLALMAADAGMTVFGSDVAAGAVNRELAERGIRFCLGEQDGEFLSARIKGEGVDWFVHTSALPEDHPELQLARKKHLKISKRDEFIAYLVERKKMRMVAIAGTHGKTTTAAMIVWAAQELGLPVSYSIGATLPFAPAGLYRPESDLFVYEADEFDKNFLAFHPWLAVIPAVSYDHPDIYPTEQEYLDAFRQFESQSQTVLHGDEILAGITLAGEARRLDATLAADAIMRMLPERRGLLKRFDGRRKQVVEILNRFPGASRRFEQVSEGYYSDYAHHPEEVASTVEIAREEADRRGLRGVVVVYEPHQDSRQRELIDGYADAFSGVEKLYWLPTFITRENSRAKHLRPQDFIAKLSNKKVAEPAELGDQLAADLQKWHAKGYLVLLMTAGPADRWLRDLVYAGNQASAVLEYAARCSDSEF